MAARKVRSTIPAWICRSNHLDPHVLCLGESDDIKVEVTGIPTPKVKFFLGGKPLKDGAFFKVRKSRFVYILTIVQATENLNEEELVVTATNSAGVDLLVLDIKVYRILRANVNIMRKARSQTLRAPDSVFVQRRQKLRVLRGGQSLCSLGSISSLPGKHGSGSSQYSIPARHAQLLQMSMDEDVFLDPNKPAASKSRDGASYYINDPYHQAGETSFCELEDLESPPRATSSTIGDTSPNSPSGFSARRADSGFESDQQRRRKMYRSTDDMYEDQDYNDPRFSYDGRDTSRFSTFKITPSLPLPHSPNTFAQVHDTSPHYVSPEHYDWQQESLVTKQVTTTEHAHDEGSLKKKKKKKKPEDAGSENGDKVKKKRKKRAASDSMNDQSFRSDVSGHTFPESAGYPVYQNISDVSRQEYGIHGEFDRSVGQHYTGEAISPIPPAQTEDAEEPKKKKKKKRRDSPSKERSKSADAVEEAHLQGQSTLETVLTDQQITTVVTDHEAKHEHKKKKKKKKRDPDHAEPTDRENVDPSAQGPSLETNIDNVLIYGDNASPVNTASAYSHSFETDIDSQFHVSHASNEFRAPVQTGYRAPVETDIDSLTQTTVETTIDSPPNYGINYGAHGQHMETDIDVPPFETDLDAPLGHMETEIDPPGGRFETDVDALGETNIDSSQFETAIDSPYHQGAQLVTDIDAYPTETDIDQPVSHGYETHDLSSPSHNIDADLSTHRETDIDSFVLHDESAGTDMNAQTWDAVVPGVTTETDLDSYVPVAEAGFESPHVATETNIDDVLDQEVKGQDDRTVVSEEVVVVTTSEKHKKKKKKKTKDGISDKSADNSFEVLDDGEKDRSLKRKKKKKHGKSTDESVLVETTPLSDDVSGAQQQDVVIQSEPDTVLLEHQMDSTFQPEAGDQTPKDADIPTAEGAKSKKPKKSKEGKSKKKKHAKAKLTASEENLIELDQQEPVNESVSLEHTREELMASEGDVSSFLGEPTVQKTNSWIVEEDVADILQQRPILEEEVAPDEEETQTPDSKKKKKKKQPSKNSTTSEADPDSVPAPEADPVHTEDIGIAEIGQENTEEVLSHSIETNIDEPEHSASPDRPKKKKKKHSSKKSDTVETSVGDESFNVPAEAPAPNDMYVVTDDSVFHQETNISAFVQSEDTGILENGEQATGEVVSYPTETNITDTLVAPEPSASPDQRKKKKKKHSSKKSDTAETSESFSVPTGDQASDDINMITDDSVFPHETNIDDIFLTKENIDSPGKRKKRKSSKKHDTSQDDILNEQVFSQDQVSDIRGAVIVTTGKEHQPRKKKKRSSKKSATQSTELGSQEDILMNVSNDSMLNTSEVPDSLADQSIEVFAHENVDDSALVPENETGDHKKKKTKKRSKSASKSLLHDSNENILSIEASQEYGSTHNVDINEAYYQDPNVGMIINGEAPEVPKDLNSVERKKKKKMKKSRSKSEEDLLATQPDEIMAVTQESVAIEDDVTGTTLVVHGEIKSPETEEKKKKKKSRKLKSSKSSLLSSEENLLTIESPMHDSFEPPSNTITGEETLEMSDEKEKKKKKLKLRKLKGSKSSILSSNENLLTEVDQSQEIEQDPQSPGFEGGKDVAVYVKDRVDEVYNDMAVSAEDEPSTQERKKKKKKSSKGSKSSLLSSQENLLSVTQETEPEPMHVDVEVFIQEPGDGPEIESVPAGSVLGSPADDLKKKKKKKKKSMGSKSSLLDSQENILSLQPEYNKSTEYMEGVADQPEATQETSRDIDLQTHEEGSPTQKKKKKKKKSSMRASTEDLINDQPTIEPFPNSVQGLNGTDINGPVIIGTSTPEPTKTKKIKTKSSSKKLRASKSSLQASTDDLVSIESEKVGSIDWLQQEHLTSGVVLTESPETRKKKKKKKDKLSKISDSKSSLQAASITSLQGSEPDLLSVTLDPTNQRYSIKDIDAVIMDDGAGEVPNSEFFAEQTVPPLSIESTTSPEPKKKKKKKTKKTGSKSSLVASEENLLSIDNKTEHYTLAEPGEVSEHAVQHTDNVFVTENKHTSKTKPKFKPVIKKKKKHSWKRSTPSESSSVYSEQSLNESFDVEREMSPAPVYTDMLRGEHNNNNMLYGDQFTWGVHDGVVSQEATDFRQEQMPYVPGMGDQDIGTPPERDPPELPEDIAVQEDQDQTGEQYTMHSYGVDEWKDPLDAEEKTSDHISINEETKESTEVPTEITEQYNQQVMHSYGVGEWKDPLDVDETEETAQDSSPRSSQVVSPEEDEQVEESERLESADLDDALKEYLDPNLIVTEISVPDAQTRQIIDELTEQEQGQQAEAMKPELSPPSSPPPPPPGPETLDAATIRPTDTIAETALAIGQVVIESGNEQSEINRSLEQAEDSASPSVPSPKRLRHKYHSTENILAGHELQVFDGESRNRYHSTENILSQKKPRAKSEDVEFGDLPEEKLRQYASAEILDSDPDYSKLLTQKQRAKSMSALFHGKKRPPRNVVCKTIRVFKGVRTVTTVDEVITEIRKPGQAKDETNEQKELGAKNKVPVDLPKIVETEEKHVSLETHKDESRKAAVTTTIVQTTEHTKQEITETIPKEPFDVSADLSDHEEYNEEKELLEDVVKLASEESDIDEDFLNVDQVNGAPLESGEESENTDAEQDVSDDEDQITSADKPVSLPPRSPKRVTISEEIIVHGEESDSGTTSSDNGDSSDSYEINTEDDHEHIIDNIWIGSLGNYLKTSRVAQQLVTQGLVLPGELGLEEGDVQEESPADETTESDEYVEAPEESGAGNASGDVDESVLDRARDEDQFEEDGVVETSIEVTTEASPPDESIQTEVDMQRESASSDDEELEETNEQWQTEVKTSIEVTTETLVPIVIGKDDMSGDGSDAEPNQSVPRPRKESSSSDDEAVIEAMVYDTYEVSQYTLRTETVVVYQNEDSEGLSEDEPSEPSPRGVEMTMTTTEVSNTERYSSMPEDHHFRNGLEDVPEEEEEEQESSVDSDPQEQDELVGESGASSAASPGTATPSKPSSQPQTPDNACTPMFAEKAFVGSLVSNLGDEHHN